MDGILIVNKPQEWTSFDVVAKIRNMSGTKKVGHSGTLDPMATGVLPVFLGKATKSIQYFANGDKEYLAEMTLGIKTDTGDAEGVTLTRVNLNDNSAANIPLPEGEGMRVRAVEEKLKKYIGEIEQVPPMYSAVKINGQRLYKLARKGIEIERPARKVTIHKIELLNYEDGENSKVTIDVHCSKGTYIRQLVVDIGDDLGCGAHLSKLVRTYAHPFHITQALNMETIVTLAGLKRLESVIIPVDSVLTGVS